MCLLVFSVSVHCVYAAEHVGNTRHMLAAQQFSKFNTHKSYTNEQMACLMSIATPLSTVHMTSF